LCPYLDIIGPQAPQTRVLGQGEVVCDDTIGPQAHQARVLGQGELV